MTNSNKQKVSTLHKTVVTLQKVKEDIINTTTGANNTWPYTALENIDDIIEQLDKYINSIEKQDKR